MSPDPATVGIVIVNYNGRRFLADCLRALYSGTTSDFEVVVVDNASVDGSADEIRALFPSAVLLLQSQNIGVAAGNNIGIDYCRRRGHRYLLILNYDTLPSPTLLEELLAVAGPRVLVSGYTVFWEDEHRSNSHAGGFDWKLGRLEERFLGARLSDTQPVEEVEMADTCCLLVPREVLDTIGVMDPAYFMYYDDTDFVVRARRAGFTCVLNPRARLRHFERGAVSGSGALSPNSTYYYTRNRLYFMNKHAPAHLKAIFLPYFALTRTASMLQLLGRGDVEAVRAMLKGISDFASGKMGARPA